MTYRVRSLPLKCAKPQTSNKALFKNRSLKAAASLGGIPDAIPFRVWSPSGPLYLSSTAGNENGYDIDSGLLWRVRPKLPDHTGEGAKQVAGDHACVTQLRSEPLSGLSMEEHAERGRLLKPESL